MFPTEIFKEHKMMKKTILDQAAMLESKIRRISELQREIAELQGELRVKDGIIKKQILMMAEQTTSTN